MSIQAVAAVLDTDIGEVSAKMLLISIANAHNTGTGLCCPPIDRLAKESGMGRSTVKRWLRWLEVHRFLKVEISHAENGRQQSHQYRLTLGEGSKLDPSEGSKLDPVQVGLEPTSGLGEGFTGGPPLKEPEEKPTPPKAPQLVQAFAELIEIWPRMKDDHRSEVWELFNALDEGDQAKLITAARRYPAECRAEAARRGRTLDQHVPYTKTLPKWIEERKWLGSEAFVSTAGKTSLNRHDPLYEACCAIEGKHWALEAQSCQFADGTVDRARKERFQARTISAGALS